MADDKACGGFGKCQACDEEARINGPLVATRLCMLDLDEVARMGPDEFRAVIGDLYTASRTIEVQGHYPRTD